jgi:hypothetical protein
MKDFFQALQDAFPVLRNHPVLMARLTLAAIVLAALYLAKNMRKRLCHPLRSRLYDRIFATSRWLRVYRNSNDMAEWKYYTSETTGSGHSGDDIIWTLVHWPSLKPKDSFRVHGAVGMVEGIRDSQAKLLARWQIVHDPDGLFIGPVPARGLRSALRRAAAEVLHLLGSSF